MVVTAVCSAMLCSRAQEGAYAVKKERACAEAILVVCDAKHARVDGTAIIALSTANQR